MDERIALTRAVAQRMLFTKPWPSLLRSHNATERTGHMYFTAHPPLQPFQRASHASHAHH